MSQDPTTSPGATPWQKPTFIGFEDPIAAEDPFVVDPEAVVETLSPRLIHSKPNPFAARAQQASLDYVATHPLVDEISFAADESIVHGGRVQELLFDNEAIVNKISAVEPNFANEVHSVHKGFVIEHNDADGGSVVDTAQPVDIEIEIPVGSAAPHQEARPAGLANLDNGGYVSANTLEILDAFSWIPLCVELEPTLAAQAMAMDMLAQDASSSTSVRLAAAGLDAGAVDDVKEWDSKDGIDVVPGEEGCSGAVRTWDSHAWIFGLDRIARQSSAGSRLNGDRGQAGEGERRESAPKGWPTIGIARSGWEFCTLAKPGEAVCVLILAIESHRPDLIEPILDAMRLKTAPPAWRDYAGEIVVRGSLQISYLDRESRYYLQAISLLVTHGARISGGLARLARQNVHYLRLPSSAILDQSVGVAPGSEMQIDSHVTTSYPACLVLDLDRSHHGAAALQKLIQDDVPGAIAYREPALSNGCLLHLIVEANLPQLLVATTQAIGPALLQVQDAKGRTAADLARELKQGVCEHVLRVQGARLEAELALQSMRSGDFEKQ